jgi:hypothetical protein
VIAEIGQTHHGDTEGVKKLADVASRCLQPVTRILPPCVGLKQRVSKCQAIKDDVHLFNPKTHVALRGRRGMPRLYVGFFHTFTEARRIGEKYDLFVEPVERPSEEQADPAIEDAFYLFRRGPAIFQPGITALTLADC